MLLGESFPQIPRNSRTLQHHLYSLLQNCDSIKKITQVHTQIIVNNFSQKNYLLVKLISSYITSGSLTQAHHVSQQIENPSTTIWNQMIRGHAKSQTPQRSVELYNQMRATEANPSGFTYSFLINACSKSGLLTEGKQIHCRVLASGFCSNLFVQTSLLNFYSLDTRNWGILNARNVFCEMRERNIVTWNTMLCGYIRCGDLNGAEKLFYEMPERSSVSYTTLISGFSKSGRFKKALGLFSDMRRSDVGIDQVAMVAALSACSEAGDLKIGKWIHSYIEKSMKNQPLLVSLFNSLIHMYSCCGVIEEAYKIFLKIPKPNTVSFTTMITCFARHGLAEKALTLFASMQTLKDNGVRPDAITFIGVLSACSHAGLVNKGRYYFEAMKKIYGIEARVMHYGCMIDTLSRAGFLNEAYQLVHSMPLEPNEAIWGSLLGGSKIYRDVELGSYVARELMVGLNPNQAAGYIMLLSNLYADVRKWDYVSVLKKRLVEMGLKKPAGQSWLQIDGVFHYFGANDCTHMQSTEIYHMLGQLTAQAVMEGYVLADLQADLDFKK